MVQQRGERRHQMHLVVGGFRRILVGMVVTRPTGPFVSPGEEGVRQAGILPQERGGFERVGDNSRRPHRLDTKERHNRIVCRDVIRMTGDTMLVEREELKIKQKKKKQKKQK